MKYENIKAIKELIKAAKFGAVINKSIVAAERAIDDEINAPERKIVQIAESVGKADWSFTALCNDGTVWTCGNGIWEQLPPIPQGDAS